MKKAMKFFSMAALCIATVAMVGCSKDEEQPAGSGEVVVSTTTIGLESDAASKHLDESGTKTFAAGEKVAVIYQNSGGTQKAVTTLTAGDISNGGKTATITVSMTSPTANSAVKIIYPASMANANGTVNYDALYNNQDGTMATLSSNFDYAEYSGTLNNKQLPASPTLANKLAVLRFTVLNTANSQDMTGSVTKLTVKHGSDIYSVTPATSGQSTFWVAVKPITANNGDIAIYAAVGKDLYKRTVSSYSALVAGSFNRITVGATRIPGALSGLFRVNAAGDLIYFSQGNLQATYGGGTWSWAFAEKQWGYIGNAACNTSINGHGTVSANGTVDLFGWVGNSSTVLTSAPAMYGISNSTTHSDYGTYGYDALKSDWGANAITNGGNAANMWRSLTGGDSGEWKYLFDTRTSGSTVIKGTTTISNARYTHATINTNGTSMNGIILFPDNVTFAAGEATWGTINGNSTWDNATKCTSAQWSALEAKGCVFLPAAGYRDGATGTTVIKVDRTGAYWSSTHNVPYNYMSYFVEFYSGSLNPVASVNDRNGFSVRLVSQVE